MAQPCIHTTTWDLNIPTLILHYENYTNNFDETKDLLLGFLDQDGIHEPPLFVTGKTYTVNTIQMKRLRLLKVCLRSVLSIRLGIIPNIILISNVFFVMQVGI